MSPDQQRSMKPDPQHFAKILYPKLYEEIVFTTQISKELMFCKKKLRKKTKFYFAIDQLINGLISCLINLFKKVFSPLKNLLTSLITFLKTNSSLSESNHPNLVILLYSVTRP